MAFPTTELLIDRKDERRYVEQTIATLQNHQANFAAVEFHGLAGLGKSRIMDWVARELHDRKIPTIGFTFEPAHSIEFTSQGLKLQVLNQIAGTLGSVYGKNIAAHSQVLQDPVAFKEFRSQIGELTQDQPLVLMLEDVHYCPSDVFDWLGVEFIGPLAAEGCVKGVGVFLAGRGAQVAQSGWPQPLQQRTRAYRLPPMQSEIVAEHLANLPPDGRYRDAAQHIFKLSNGHPYSTEVVAHYLTELGVPISAVQGQRKDLAKRLYDEVIKKYILKKSPDWVLPLIEVAAIPRRFELSLLRDLARTYRPQNGTDQSRLWYASQLQRLQQKPLHLVCMDHGIPAYQLEAPLRQLLHAALAILFPDETIRIHQDVKKSRSELLANKVAGAAPAAGYILEILYHAGQIQAISEAPFNPTLHETLQDLLEEHFSNQREPDDLIHLRDLLRQDDELRLVIGSANVDALIDQIRQFNTQPFPVPAGTGQKYKRGYLSITRFEGTGYMANVYVGDERAPLTEEPAYTSLIYPIEKWRERLVETGQTAFGLYLQPPVQEYIRDHVDLSIELRTNATDIPWELLHDGTEFLCLSRPIGRVPETHSSTSPRVRGLPGLPPHPIRVLVVGDPGGDLPGARAEAESVAALLHDTIGAQVTRLIGPADATAEEFSIKLKTGGYQLVHFAGHGTYDPIRPKATGLRLSNTTVSAGELARLVSPRTFFFFSACTAVANEGSTTLAGYRGDFAEGLAAAALRGDALGCLGPLWEIEDGWAIEFAKRFYQALVAGDTLGGAALSARRALKSNGSDLWASWILYGNPVHVMFPPAGSQAHQEQ